MARPSIYTKELADKICERIAGGESVRSICKDEGMPEAKSIYNWLRDEDKSEFLQQYTRARDSQAELMFEEIIEIADEAENAIVGDDKSDSARVQAKKLRMDARHWHLSKLRPKKYGDKLDLTSDGKVLPTPILNVLSSALTTACGCSPQAQVKGEHQEDCYKRNVLPNNGDKQDTEAK